MQQAFEIKKQTSKRNIKKIRRSTYKVHTCKNRNTIQQPREQASLLLLLLLRLFSQHFDIIIFYLVWSFVVVLYSVAVTFVNYFICVHPTI